MICCARLLTSRAPILSSKLRSIAQQYGVETIASAQAAYHIEPLVGLYGGCMVVLKVS
jgi:hypothetical protein